MRVLANPSKRQKIEKAITFSKEDAQGINFLHNNMVVIALNIVNYDVCYILVDNRSSVDILYYDLFSKIDISLESFERLDLLIIKFLEEAVPVERVITIFTGQAPRQSMTQVDSLIIKILLVYNAILG